MCGKENGQSSNPSIALTLTTAGGRIKCLRCNAMSKRTKLQCGGPAVKGKTKCRFHGGLSTGPKTELGRQICAAAKTVHGKDSRTVRQVHRLTTQRLRLYAELLGVPFRIDAGFKRLCIWCRGSIEHLTELFPQYLMSHENSNVYKTYHI